MTWNLLRALLAATVILPLRLDADPGQMSCESLPPTCWLCEHHYPGGTTYVWWDTPAATGQISIHAEQPWMADYHCYNQNYPYTVIVHAERQNPTPVEHDTGGVGCSTV